MPGVQSLLLAFKTPLSRVVRNLNKEKSHLPLLSASAGHATAPVWKASKSVSRQSESKSDNLSSQDMTRFSSA